MRSDPSGCTADAAMPKPPRRCSITSIDCWRKACRRSANPAFDGVSRISPSLAAMSTLPASSAASACKVRSRSPASPQPHLDDAVARRETRKGDARLTQEAAHVVTQTDQDRLAQRVGCRARAGCAIRLAARSAAAAFAARAARIFSSRVSMSGAKMRSGTNPRTTASANSPAERTKSPAASQAVLRKFKVMTRSERRRSGAGPLVARPQAQVQRTSGSPEHLFAPM